MLHCKIFLAVIATTQRTCSPSCLRKALMMSDAVMHCHGMLVPRFHSLTLFSRSTRSSYNLPDIWSRKGAWDPKEPRWAWPLWAKPSRLQNNSEHFVSPIIRMSQPMRKQHKQNGLGNNIPMNVKEFLHGKWCILQIEPSTDYTHNDSRIIHYIRSW